MKWIAALVEVLMAGRIFLSPLLVGIFAAVLLYWGGHPYWAIFSVVIAFALGILWIWKITRSESPTTFMGKLQRKPELESQENQQM
ncbi:MAG: hypothetical protein JNL57_13775 [Bacteroidetes bacterium]|nr:hypothetical protein [Bacteroidota bacterium]